MREERALREKKAVEHAQKQKLSDLLEQQHEEKRKHDKKTTAIQTQLADSLQSNLNEVSHQLQLVKERVVALTASTAEKEQKHEEELEQPKKRLANGEQHILNMKEASARQALKLNSNLAQEKAANQKSLHEKDLQIAELGRALTIVKAAGDALDFKVQHDEKRFQKKISLLEEALKQLKATCDADIRALNQCYILLSESSQES